MSKVKLRIIALIVLSISSGGDTARILAVFPTPFLSHQVVFRPLTQELARRGHEVVVITTDPAFPPGRAPANLTEIDVHDVSYDTWRKSLIDADVGKEKDIYKQLKYALKTMLDIIEAQVRVELVNEIVRNEKGKKFDLLIIESCALPALVFSHIYKAPVILISSFGTTTRNYEIIGASTHPLLYPTSFNQRLYNLTLWEKAKILHQYYSYNVIIKSHALELNEVLKKYFGSDLPPLSELDNNVDMIFLNTHFIYMDNPPVPPGVVYLRGLHLQPPKELPQELKKILDNSKNGVIYVSFGSNIKISMLPKEKIEMMTRVFSQLPYGVLWKWDNKEVPKRYQNIEFSKWFPQADLLRHPNVKAFVTQGGLQSTDEAITAGVPLIGIPMYLDQWFNTEKYVLHRYGIQLDWGSLTEKQFRNTINSVVEDGSYRQNIRHFRNLLNDQPQPPLERAVWWVEYVLRHGGAKHLRAPAANMPWTQYYELELVLLTAFSVAMIALVIYFLICYIWKLLLNLSIYLNNVKVKKFA